MVPSRRDKKSSCSRRPSFPAPNTLRAVSGGQDGRLLQSRKCRRDSATKDAVGGGGWKK